MRKLEKLAAVVPSGYKLSRLRDGSYGLYSQKFDQMTHSNSGAWLETQVRFIKGCKLSERARLDPKIDVFETGFGTGLGAISYLLATKNSSGLMVSLEEDSRLVDFAMEYAHLLNLKIQLSPGPKFFNFNSVWFGPRVLVLIGNASDLPNFSRRLKHYLPRDFRPKAIFHDPYSPKVNPELWTAEYFTLMRKLAHPEAILSTYSAARVARQAMIKAGWIVSAGPKLKTKRDSTLATLPHSAKNTVS